MCGIAGIIYRNGGGDREVGRDMTRMLQAMKHRGPDSTGFALYRGESDSYVMHVKLSEAESDGDPELAKRMDRRRDEVEARMRAAGAAIEEIKPGERTMTVVFGFDGDPKLLADAAERVRNAEVLSLGRSLEIVKDLGDADTVAAQYALDDYVGTHAIGHARMATESDVDIANAHPYWAYPFPDVAVVHNGQLTNFHAWRRRLQRSGHRFQSECDSEIIAVYLAQQMSEGRSLEQAHGDDGVLGNQAPVRNSACLTGRFGVLRAVRIQRTKCGLSRARRRCLRVECSSDAEPDDQHDGKPSKSASHSHLH